MPTGSEIKRLRESQQKKISAERAAKLIGIDVDRLRKWEQRDADPKDSDDIKKVETYFKIKLSELYKLDNFQFYEPDLSDSRVSSKDMTTQMLLDLVASNTKLVESNSKLVDNTVDLTQMVKSRFNFDVLIKNQSAGPSIVDRLLVVMAEMGVPEKWATKEAGEKALHKLVYGDEGGLKEDHIYHE